MIIMTVNCLSGEELSNNTMLDDFIYCELTCEGMRDDLKRLIESGHMVSFEYECNQYSVMYEGKAKRLSFETQSMRSIAFPNILRGSLCLQRTF